MSKQAGKKTVTIFYLFHSSQQVFPVPQFWSKDQTDGSKKKKAPKISQKLSDLVNYIHAVHFHGFDNPQAAFFHMSSFGESKTKKLLSGQETGMQWVKYNSKQISR